jgi:tetratricopeptide (TPR) repeat protein
LLVLAFFALALTANRNVLLFFWVALPIAVTNAAPHLAALTAGGRARVPAIAWALACATTAGLLVFALTRETRLDQPAPFRVPAESARRIGEDPGEGRIFCADHYGGYFIWTLHPRAAPYLDTRLVLRTADEYAEFLALLEQPDRWEDFSRRHPFDHAALPTDYPDRYLPLAAHLYRSADWRLVYTDGTESLFRHDPDHRHPAVDLGARATTDRILAEQHRRYPRPEVAEAARRQLARLDLALGHPEECLYVLSPLTVDPIAQALAGRCHLQIGDLTAAEATGRRLLERDPDSIAGFDLLALVALARGDLAGGIGWLRKALAADPYDPEARAILDQLEAQANQPTTDPVKPR